MDHKFESHAQVLLGTRVFIGKYSAIGCPMEQRIKLLLSEGLSLDGCLAPVKLSDNCIIGNHVTIYEGVEIGCDTIIEDNIRIGYNSVIGRNVRIMHRAYICDRVTISDNARISGYICDGAQVGERSTVMGNLLHEYTRPHLGWWDVNEDPPIIENDVVVAWGANVIGAIRVSSRTYIAAGAIVTKDVPPGHIVIGVNRQIPLERWKGKRLDDLIRYWTHDKR